MSSFEYKDLKITWFNHASFLIEWRGERIFIDPFVLPEQDTGSGTHEPKPATVIIHTHDHYDHCVETPELMTPDTELLGHCKHGQNQAGDKLKIRDIGIEFVPAYNPEKRFHPKGSGTGVILSLGETRIYHAGDTELIPEMKNIKCDIALLPIGGTYTMDIKQASQAVEMIRPKIAVPMHYNYIEGTLADPHEFEKLVQGKAPESRVVILKPLHKP